VSNTYYASKTPGDVKNTAAGPGLLKKDPTLVFDSRQPGVVRKKLIDLVTKLGIDVNSFNPAAVLTKVEIHRYTDDIQKISHYVRDGH
jgi:hypothetical protein